MTKEEAKKMLTNTKVYVNGKSKEIQEELFEIGFKWIGSSENNVSHLLYPFLFIRDTITTDYNMITFESSELKEISADDILDINIDEEFVPKHGDIIFVKTGLYKWITIFNEYKFNRVLSYLFLINNDDKRLYDYDCNNNWLCRDNIDELRLATEEEKNKLFSALKEKCYVWNGETKKVEKIVKPKQTHEFNPFDKVLVRDFGEDNWDIDFFQEIGGEDIDYQFICLAAKWNFCIPYEGNEHLLGTSNSPK